MAVPSNGRPARAAATLCHGADARTDVGALADSSHHPAGCGVEDMHGEGVLVSQDQGAGVHDADTSRPG